MSADEGGDGRRMKEVVRARRVPIWMLTLSDIAETPRPRLGMVGVREKCTSGFRVFICVRRRHACDMTA